MYATNKPLLLRVSDIYHVLRPGTSRLKAYRLRNAHTSLAHTHKKPRQWSTGRCDKLQIQGKRLPARSYTDVTAHPLCVLVAQP